MPGCPGGQCAVPIRAGTVAPFDGQLLTPDLAANLAVRAGSCHDDLLRAREAAARAQGVVVAQLNERHRIELSLCDAKLAQLRHDLSAASDAMEAHQPPFYRQPWFVAAVSVLGTSLVTFMAMH